MSRSMEYINIYIDYFDNIEKNYIFGEVDSSRVQNMIDYSLIDNKIINDVLIELSRVLPQFFHWPCFSYELKSK